MESNLDKRYQTLLVLWFALLMNIGVFFLISIFAAPEIGEAPANPASRLLILVFTAVGTFLVLISFVVKKKLLESAVEKQDVNLVQKGLIVACALCEVSAILGLIERFISDSRQYYALFLLAAAGTALHFPRRSQLEAASFKSRNNLT